MEAIRIFLAFATYMNFKVYQMDVKNDFLNGKIKEEVYVKQPPGFESSEFPNYVCKLDKALFGLKQAPKAWYETLSTFLIQKKFSRGRIVLCARYQSNLKESYLTAGKRIRRKSTSGARQILGEKLVGVLRNSSQWLCPQWKLNLLLMLGVVQMKSQLSDYDINYKMVTIFCDNTSAIAISNNLVLLLRTKHINIRYHFIRDHILKGDIELHFILTEYQLADIFTKPLDEPTFTRLKAELGMLNID
nr:retrovirus-related Pol polyprotein from transposon TNT 1-94 [Tanacetum cinerariifolium]